MANTRTKDVGVTKTTLAADTYLYGDGNTDGSHKILGSDVANYVASEEGGSTLATLTAGKVPASQLPSGFDAGTYLGLWDANANSPALSNGSGTQGDYYIVGTAGTTSIDGISSWAVGDEIRANASAWEKLTPGTTAVTQGGTGATTAEGARTNLEVDSKDEIAEGLTRNEPSLYFNGSDEWVSVAHNAALNFSDTTNTDDLPFTVEFWINGTDYSSTARTRSIVSKFSSNRGWKISYYGDDLFFWLGDGTDTPRRFTSNSLDGLEGQWTHFAFVFPGAGPTSSDSFSNCLDNLKLYQNGVDISSQLGSTAGIGSYAGMYRGSTANTGALRIANHADDNEWAEGEIREVRVYNSALTAAQVEQVYRSGVPFELDQASAGDIYTGDSSTFASGLGNWTEEGATSITVTQSGGEMLVTNTAASTGTRGPRNIVDSFRAGKRHRISFDVYASSGTGQSIQLRLYNSGGLLSGARVVSGGGSLGSVGSQSLYSFTPTGSSVRHVIEFAASRASGDTQQLYFNLNNTGAGEVYNFDDITLVEAGAILDLDIPSTNGTTVPDRSGNGFNGTLNSMTVAGNVVGLPSTLASYSPNPSSGQALLALANGGSGDDFSIDEDWSGTWTPSLTFGGASTGITYTTQSGYYSKVGNVCICVFRIALSSKGSASGSTLLEGLPFSAKGIGYRGQAGSLAYYSGMSGLTGVPITAVNTGVTNANLSQFGAASIQDVTNSQFTNTSDIRGTIIYLTD